MNQKNKPIRELFIQAKEALIGRFGIAICAATLVSLVQYLASIIISPSGNELTVSNYLLTLVISIVIDLLCGVLFYGQAYFFLNLSRDNANPSPADLFFGFKRNADKAILIQSIFTFVSLLGTLPNVLINFGVIPVSEKSYTLVRLGILAAQALLVFIARLFFGLSYYILCDNPNATVKETLLGSLALMKKQKGRLILVYLRVVPLFILGLFACGIGVLWPLALLNTVNAFFYRSLIVEDLNHMTPPVATEITD